jgi:hypothetical protein
MVDLALEPLLDGFIEGQGFNSRFLHEARDIMAKCRLGEFLDWQVLERIRSRMELKEGTLARDVKLRSTIKGIRCYKQALIRYYEERYPARSIYTVGR